MGFTINNKALANTVHRNLEQAKKKQADSLAKLATGSRFAGSDSMPAERAIAESMEFRVRSLSASKRNINDAISLLQTAESSMAEINNIITRMKEINISAASTTVSDQERRYLFIEYEALFDEINRIALTTEFNGIPLLNGESDETPDELIFRVDDPFVGEDGFDPSEDVNTIRFSGLKSVTATPWELGLQSAEDILEDTSDEEGIELEDVEEMLLPEDEDAFATAYDQAIGILATHRAVFGALQSRLNRTLDFLDVYQENISAAKSKIADTDYAQEIANLLSAKVASHATTALLTHVNDDSQQVLALLNTI